MNQALTGVRAVVFDFDDTLVVTASIKWHQHVEVAQRHFGVSLTQEDFDTYWGLPFGKLLQGLYRSEAPVEELAALFHSLDSHFLKTDQPAAIATVEKLAARGYRLGVLSSMTRSSVTEDLTRIGFPADAFIAIQGSEDTHIHKPDPAVFNPMLSRLGAEGYRPNEVLYIGDTLDDFRSSTSAGAQFLGVSYGLASSKAFDEVGAGYIDSLHTLLALLP